MEVELACDSVRPCAAYPHEWNSRESSSNWTNFALCVSLTQSVSSMELTDESKQLCEALMDERILLEKKPPTSAAVYTESRLLVGRREAARMLSISQRSLDYLIANKELRTRRIGTRVLIALTELQRYARADHPKPLAS